METILAQQPLLTLFIVVALGAAIGAIRLGPVRLGAAGALFVGLALSAASPSLANDWTIVQQLGLLLFVYTVGIAAGATIRSGLKENLSLLLLAGLASLVGAVVIAAGAGLLHLPAPLSAGLFTGALTAAPALDAATRLTGSADPAVGYSFAYPLGALVGVILVSIVAGRPWRGRRDTPSLAGRGLHAVTVRVAESVNPREIAAWADQRIRLSYVEREGTTRVLIPGEDLRAGDLVVMVGEPGSVEETAREIGDIAADHLADHRDEVEFERMVLSNPDLAGREVGELNLPARFGAVVTRVRRGDLDLLARDDLALQLGDQVAVVVARDHLQAVRDHFGDSQRQVSEVDALALGVGLVLGLLLGMVSLPLPGGESFALGAAAGPLVMGMVLGSFRRTGPLVWTLPDSANLTIRQLGLLFFLAALGLGAGPQVAQLLRSPSAWPALIISVAAVLVACLVVLVGGRLAGMSAPRTAGGIAGFLGQPAVLQAANSRVRDERVESAYSTLFAASIVVKILLVPLVVAVLS
ncbi:TrkA C-terminal domain-containing protein [Scrofimicrobium sp. R131]|uniref:TrkA C-terminal domain-containing protein n=1 Tax=Scrofimicrobium appendicitidis TaxID=3079930 RepID=A0AAU7V8T5_9ACTO